MKTFQFNTNALADALAEEFMLADIRIGTWGGKFRDRPAAVEIAAEDVSRSFFPGNLGVPFKNINAMLNKVRTEHYAMTLPWSVVDKDSGERRTGARLLPTASLFDHATVIAKAEQKLPLMLAEIEKTYDDLVREAAATANQGKFSENYYPAWAEIAERYNLYRHYSPLVVPDDFNRVASLDGRVVQKMIERMASAQQEMLGNAVDDLWSRLTAAVFHLVERLSDDADGDKQRIHESVLSNVGELVNQGRSFKLAEDSRVNEVFSDIEHDLLGSSIKDIRDDDSLRRNIRSKAMTIAESLQALA